VPDVLLTHSYHLFHDRKQIRKMQPYPPLGTLYAASLLRRHGHSVALFDSMLESPTESFSELVRRLRPRIVAVYEDSFNFLSKMCLNRMREDSYGMIAAAKAAGARVVVNGSDASDRSGEYLSRGADYVLLGEAEWTLLELVGALVGDGASRRPEEVRGLAYLRQGESVVRTLPRPLMENLDDLPFPARDLVDISGYRDAWKRAHGYFSLNLIASRGCPYRCNWCARPIYGQTFNVRSPLCVAEEMRELRDRYGADHLWFADDLFGIRPEWLGELADHVGRLDAAVPFKMQSRVDLMGPDSVDALRRAGCAEVWMGVESGSQKILDSMDKGTSVAEIVRASARLRGSGIRSCFFVQFGYPGETWEDIEKTVELIRETRPDDIGVSVSYPLPGTVFHERVRGQLGDQTHWIDSEDLAMMFRGTYTSEFYRALHDALHAEVDSWSRAAPACGAEVEALWGRVFALEETCRNPDPTEVPQWICS
jgi:anaerobic magnesium-protoporphyrin IX monomethyl ester cyclase